MNITGRLERAELVRILNASDLWDSREEVEEAVDKMEGFVVLRREGRTIDDAIGNFFIDDRDLLAGEVPDRWIVYIDAEAVGRDIRLSGMNGRAVDELDDPSGRYGRDFLHYVIRED